MGWEGGECIVLNKTVRKGPAEQRVCEQRLETVRERPAAIWGGAVQAGRGASVKS